MSRIQLSGKNDHQYMLVDDKMFFILSHHLWRLAGAGYVSHNYKVRGVDGTRTTKLVYAHRLIMEIEYGSIKGKEVDHVNLDKLDNRLCNLRLSTRVLNNVNRKVQLNNTSGYKGVSWSSQKNKWVAKVSCRPKSVHVGFFDDPKEAHEAYSRVLTEMYGEHARIE